MKVVATIMLYNDRTFLSATLESVKDHVDEILIVDGAYKAYLENLQKWRPDAKAHSTDGSIQIIQNFTGKPHTRIILPPNDEPWLNQNVKRNALLKEVRDGDWFIGIDADEMLKGDVTEGLEEIMDSGCMVGQIPLVNLGLEQDRMAPFWHPRIFQKEQGMHYYGTHWHLRDKFDRIIEERYPMKWTERFFIAHLKSLKGVESLVPHETYMTGMADRGWKEPETSKTLL